MLERALRLADTTSPYTRGLGSQKAYNAREGIEATGGVGIRAFVEICVRRLTLQP